jgi:3-hydroxyacyl-CoA dehydrogenase/enoyl-CoA hydratase/3-hydroxybutyryl-CoA epimerase
VNSPASPTSPFSLVEHADGLLELRFDLPGEKVNLLRADSMDALEQWLERLASRRDARLLVVTSGKPDVFVAGADVRAFATLADAASARAASRRGQTLFAKLAALPMATVAAIHGACVGGGLELALACTWRVASDERVTRLGLPEVLLGIVPGFGGTQRLPRVVGLTAALPLLLTGRLLSARAARRIGLVDEVVVAKEDLLDAARRVVSQGRLRRGPPRPPRRGARLVEALLRGVAPLRAFVLRRAAAAVRAKTGDLYPAPFAILEVVEVGYARGGGHGDAAVATGGFEREAQLLGEQLVGPVSRNLVRLFELSEAAPGSRDDARSIERAFVAGAGQMGAAIAASFAGAGVRTRLHDASSPALARGSARARDSLARRFREDRRALRDALDRFEPSAARVGLARSDLFLEAIVEQLEPKRALLAEAEAALRSGALIATNTSSLDLDALAAALARPERLVGVHFFHPVESMRLVEVVRGARTSGDAVARACGLAKRLGKVPVVVANRPGFLVNRVLAPYLLEAERLVAEGVDVVALDRTLREAGMAMGPVELLDEVGLDVALHVGDVMRAAFPSRFEDVGVVRRLVASGALGRKSGRGFYVHARTRRGAALRRPAELGATGGAVDVAEARERTLLLVVAESWRALEERVVATEDELDLAASLGAGILVPHGGPTRWGRTQGLARVVERLDAWRARLGARFDAPESLRRAAATSPSCVGPHRLDAGRTGSALRWRPST